MRPAKEEPEFLLFILHRREDTLTAVFAAEKKYRNGKLVFVG